jgi:competence protein CoiA
MKMKYALVNNERQEPKPGLIGKCQCCNSAVIAKCGNQKIWHWAHKTKVECDPWWEESDWHRAWKEQFPKEWQEIIHKAENDEKHIADVKTDRGFVIEFQHSHLDPQERVAREIFYQNMVWVVDGTRLKKDYPRFLEGRKHIKTGYKNGFFLVHFPEECFPIAWVESSKVVIFDFKSTLPNEPQDEMRNTLWCLLPGRARNRAVMIGISRQDFVATAMKQPGLLPEPAHEIVSAYDKLLIELEAREGQVQIQRHQIRNPYRATIPKRR